MVQIGELLKKHQEIVERLFEKVDEMNNSPDVLKQLSIEMGDGNPGCVATILAIIAFKKGGDSWELLKIGEDIKDLGVYFSEKGETELLRDLLEIRFHLEQLPTEESYCPFG